MHVFPLLWLLIVQASFARTVGTKAWIMTPGAIGGILVTEKDPVFSPFSSSFPGYKDYGYRLLEAVDNARFDVEPSRILVVGTGLGYDAIWLAHRFPDARIIATDISPAAIEVARDNIAEHGLGDRISLLESDLLDRVEGQFDLIIFNAPRAMSRDGNPEVDDAIHDRLLEGDAQLQRLAEIKAYAEGISVDEGAKRLRAKMSSERYRLKTLKRHRAFTQKVAASDKYLGLIDLDGKLLKRFLRQVGSRLSTDGSLFLMSGRELMVKPAQELTTETVTPGFEWQYRVGTELSSRHRDAFAIHRIRRMSSQIKK